MSDLYDLITDENLITDQNLTDKEKLSKKFYFLYKRYLAQQVIYFKKLAKYSHKNDLVREEKNKLDESLMVVLVKK